VAERVGLDALLSADPPPGGPGVEPTRLTRRDLAAEALAGLCQRPLRTALTMLGTVLGVGAFVAILGLTATAAGQISASFSALSATEVTVRDVGAQPGQSTVDSFPADAGTLVGRLNGVVHAGVSWVIGGGPAAVAATGDPRAGSTPLRLAAASPGYLAALDPTLASGTLYNDFHERRRMNVAVLGAGAARQLGISSTANQPAVFVRGVGYTVVGILRDVARQPDALLSVLIPVATAEQAYGQPAADSPASMLIETRLGAAALIARQAPTQLRPDAPALLQAVPPPDAQALHDDVVSSLNGLFVVLAAITLVIGAVGIANTTFVAVLERTGEIGLRRAVGARPRQIAGQFLAETTAIGTLGGLVGTAIGIATVLIVALARSWTAILDPTPTLLAPLIGTLTGLLAGLAPAVRAARVEPLAALRR
jgi:putative ABC transport system permease protein